MTAILIGASIPHEPLVRPLAIPVSLFFIQVGSELIISGVANVMHVKAPFKMSSVAKGERVPPMVLTIVEDIVGVDGGAGKSYRKRLMDRYHASPRFRKMIRTMNWFWGIGSVLCGIGTLVVIWTVPQEVAYGVGEFSCHHGDGGDIFSLLSGAIGIRLLTFLTLQDGVARLSSSLYGL